MPDTDSPPADTQLDPFEEYWQKTEYAKADLPPEQIEGMRTFAKAFWDQSRYMGASAILMKEMERKNWEDTARQESENRDYYRGLLDECAEHLGDAVFIADDGSKMDEPIRAKIPDLVAALADGNRGMALCPKCGNKRCPRAEDCEAECTGSNKAG